jgi:hypothetical protein
VLTFGAIATHAQGFGGPGGMQPPPGMAANRKAWDVWHSTHKNVRALQHTIHALQTVEQDPQARLSKAQAHAILAIITPWRARSVMPDSQAKQIDRQIRAVLNPAQARKLAAFRPWGDHGGPPHGGHGWGSAGGYGGPPPGGMGGPPPDGFGGPPPGDHGGPPPGGMGGFKPGARPPAFPKPKDYNPLNPGTIAFPPEQRHARQELDSLLSALKKTK